MTATFRITMADYVVANRRNALGMTMLFTAVAFALYAYNAFDWFHRGARRLDIYVQGGLTTALMVVLGIVALHLLYIPYFCRSAFRDQPSIGETRELTLYDDRFTIDYPSGAVRSTFAVIPKWDETAAHFIIYLNPAIIIPIPKREVAPEMIDAIRAALIRSGLDRPRRRRKGRT